MTNKNLNINIFLGLSYFVYSFFGSLISSDSRQDQADLFTLSLDVTIKSCPGEIVVNPVGGTPPFTYSWETRATAADPWQPLVLNGSTVTSRIIRGANPADYRVTVRDGSNPSLEAVGIYTLSPPIDLTVTTHFEGLICSADPNSGLALLGFDRGSPDYVWELVQNETVIQQGTTDDIALAIQNLAVGSYTFNWTDDNDCTGTEIIDIAGPPSPLTATFTSQDVTCPAGTDGSITVSSISGGWGATYLIRIFRNGVQYRPWGPAQANYTNLPKGVYTIEYTDKVNPANGFPFNLFTFSINQFTSCNKSVEIEINEPAAFSVPVTQSPAVCQGGTDGFLSLEPTGGSPPYQVTFYSGLMADPTKIIKQQGGVNSGQIVRKDGLAPGQYTIQLIDKNNCVYSDNFTIAQTIPTITSQPTPSQSICVGGSVPAFNVAYTGGTGTASYQWYKNTTNTNSGGAVIGINGTSASYTPPATDFITAGDYYYYAVITLSGSGCGSVTSDVARVEVVPDPVIDAQPFASQILCQNATPTNLSVTLSSVTPGLGTASYQWFSNINNSNTGGTAITPNGTAATYTPPTTTIGTTYYYVEVSQIPDGCKVVSNTASVQIVAQPAITTQPINSTVCLGGTTPALTAPYSGGTGTPTYQWYKNTTDSNSGGTLVATTTTFTPPTNSLGILYYYVELTFPPSGGCSAVKSNPAKIEVTPLITITNQPNPLQSICEGGTVTHTVAYTGGAGTASYQWYSNNTNSNTGGTLIPGAITATYTHLNSTFNTAGDYYFYAVISLDGSGCGSVTSDVARVEVVPDPVIDAQ
uniref:hypothetical protein n=1 Tax=Algoriphagus sp. TaxID=1872435 RepID=UPI004048271A